MSKLTRTTVIVSLASIFSHGAMGQNICTDPTSDPDDDGWGWENSASCRMPTTTAVQTSLPQGNCIDTDGDGWGWDGFQSCRINSTTTIPAPPSLENNGSCIDSDGDGWGWDGVDSCEVENTIPTNTAAECVDLDGDGWGWNGSESCLVRATPISFEPLTSDPTWRLCPTEPSDRTTLAFGETWGTTESWGGQFRRTCVRQCSDSATEVAGISGWGYDQSTSAECAIAIGFTGNLPIYTTGNGIERQRFENELAYPLYDGDGTWQCSTQSRVSNADAFTTTSDLTLQFDRFSVVTASQADRVSTGTWNFTEVPGAGIALSSKYLGINVSPQDSNSLNYEGPLQLDHKNFTVYNNSLDRLSCVKSNPVEYTPAIPTSRDAIRERPAMSPSSLLNRNFSCRVIESLEFDGQAADWNGEGYNNLGDWHSINNFDINLIEVTVESTLAPLAITNGDLLNSSNFVAGLGGSRDLPLSGPYVFNPITESFNTHELALDRIEGVTFREFDNFIVAESDTNNLSDGHIKQIYLCTE